MSDEDRVEKENEKFSTFGDHVTVNVRNIFDVPVCEERVENDADGKVIYQGWAIVGSAEDAAVWLISKIIYDGYFFIGRVWANGEETFDKVWDSKDTYSYTY